MARSSHLSSAARRVCRAVAVVGTLAALAIPAAPAGAAVTNVNMLPGSCMPGTPGTMGFEWPGYDNATIGQWVVIYNGVYTDLGGYSYSDPYFGYMMPTGMYYMQAGGWGVTQMHPVSLPTGQGNAWGIQWLYDYSSGQWHYRWVVGPC